MNCFLITGNDVSTIRSKAAKIANDICGGNYEDNDELEIVRGNRDDISPNEILNSFLVNIDTPPFLSDKKIVWLKHFDFFEKVLAGNAISRKGKPIETLVEYLKNGIPDDVFIIIDGPNIKRNTALFKQCKTKYQVDFFEKLDMSSKTFQADVKAFINQLLSENNKKIDFNALTYLVEILPADTGRIKSEVEKLIAYTADSNLAISLDDCREACTQTPEALRWDFTDALKKRDARSAIKTIDTLIQQQNDGGSANELSLVYGAISEFKSLSEIAKISEELKLPARLDYNFFKNPQLKVDYPNYSLFTMHPFRAMKLVEDSRRYSPAEYANIIKHLLKTNKLFVSGKINKRLVLEQLVLKIC